MAKDAMGNPDVLIVGAGPVGLSMACELARHGVTSRIIDASEGPTDQSRALGIQARTLEVFRQIGIVDQVLAKGRKVHGVSAFSDARRIAHITLDLEGLETPYPYLLILPQGDTERILLDRLKTYGIEVERRTRLTELAMDRDGVTLALVDDQGKSSESRTAWLIGCDGARSAVRKRLNFAFEGVEYEEAFLLADVRLAWDRPDDELTSILTPDGPIVAFPLPEAGHWRLVHASTGTVEDQDAESAHVVARFQTMLREHGRPEAVVSDPGWTSAFRIHRRVAGQFREGRCFIAGDAAHIHSPAGGQGMNTGIQDAYNLAWKLGLVIRGAAPESLLETYSTERRPVVAGVLQRTDFLTRAITLRSEVAKSVRNQLIGILGEFDFVARKFSREISELGVGYPGSPIVFEDRDQSLLSSLWNWRALRSAPHPGDRIPDGPLEPDPSGVGPRTLFDVLSGTTHVLLLFQGLQESTDPGPFEAVIQVAARHDPFLATYLVDRGNEAFATVGWDGPRLLDRSGELHHRFAAQGPCLYLIRPDGYLGYRAIPPDADKFAAYLRMILLDEAARNLL